MQGRHNRELIEQLFPKGAKPGTNNREIVNSKSASLHDFGITFDESSDAKIIKEKAPAQWSGPQSQCLQNANLFYTSRLVILSLRTSGMSGYSFLTNHPAASPGVIIS